MSIPSPANSYRVSGEITTFLAFAREGELNLTLSPTELLEFPSGPSNGICHPFCAIVTAGSVSEARAKAEQYLSDACAWISTCFDVAVTGKQIVSIVDPSAGATQTMQSIPGVACLTRTLDPSAASTFTNAFETLQAKPLEDLIRVRTMLSIYGEAVASRDPVRQFWLYYSILLFIVGGKSDRQAIDALIKLRSPEIALMTDHRGKMVSIFVAIRDSFSHHQMNGLTPVDRLKALTKNLPLLRAIVREELLAQMG